MENTKSLELVKSAIVAWCLANMYEEFSCIVQEDCKTCIKQKFKLTSKEMEELNLG